eukprot:TRINITY_DN1257_c0_g3_i8.p1 TRINITY_DN1257_c0_g3~~TRINITY_DN1257_c0_g3_i8.p1  ORF type:complete len:216 (-),score=31.22 TRINITY_DN1257_c0_g3_i8:183-830(-)
MLDRRLRIVKEEVCKPIAIVFSKLGMSATYITVIGFMIGLLSPLCFCYRLYFYGNLFWWINRIFDGVDGVVARMNNQTSDFGGYVDIVCDFIIYSLIPIGLVIGTNEPSDDLYIILALMEGSFFVNAVSQMFLSSILEKRNYGSKVQGEMTTVTMPDGLIEGTETLISFSIFMLFPSIIYFGYIFFSIGVGINIIYRIYWAYIHIGVDNHINSEA